MAPSRDEAAWEAELAEALDQLSDLGAEAAPDVADLQMLVAQVQREERRKAVRDLLLFWACGLVVMGGVLYTLTARPGLFVALQIGAVLALGALIQPRRDTGKQVAP